VLLDGTVSRVWVGDERGLCERKVGGGGWFGAGRVTHHFAGETKLGEFIEMAAACRVYLRMDSGGRHMLRRGC